MTKGVPAAAISASGKGPGPITASVNVAADGAVQVAFMARIAGTYTLSVISVASGEPLAGMPLQASPVSMHVPHHSGGTMHSHTASRQALHIPITWPRQNGC